MQINKSVNYRKVEEAIAAIEKLKSDEKTVRIIFSGSYDIAGKTESARIDWVTEEEV